LWQRRRYPKGYKGKGRSVECRPLGAAPPARRAQAARARGCRPLGAPQNQDYREGSTWGSNRPTPKLSHVSRSLVAARPAVSPRGRIGQGYTGRAHRVQSPHAGPSPPRQHRRCDAEFRTNAAPTHLRAVPAALPPCAQPSAVSQKASLPSHNGRPGGPRRRRAPLLPAERPGRGPRRLRRRSASGARRRPDR
jgi:hypothetical protein